MRKEWSICHRGFWLYIPRLKWNHRGSLCGVRISRYLSPGPSSSRMTVFSTLPIPSRWEFMVLILSEGDPESSNRSGQVKVNLRDHHGLWSFKGHRRGRSCPSWKSEMWNTTEIWTSLLWHEDRRKFHATNLYLMQNWLRHCGKFHGYVHKV